MLLTGPVLSLMYNYVAAFVVFALKLSAIFETTLYQCILL